MVCLACRNIGRACICGSPIRRLPCAETVHARPFWLVHTPIRMFLRLLREVVKTAIRPIRNGRSRSWQTRKGRDIGSCGGEPPNYLGTRGAVLDRGITHRDCPGARVAHRQDRTSVVYAAGRGGRSAGHRVRECRGTADGARRRPQTGDGSQACSGVFGRALAGGNCL
jgi:hypothetical protein